MLINRVQHPSGFTAHFQDRHAMKAGHPLRRMHLPYDIRQAIALPVPALPFDWLTKPPGGIADLYPMDGNDRLGDCMEAAACHADTSLTGCATGTPSVFSLTALEAQYTQLSGGDNGLDEGTLIGGWKTGLAGVNKASIFDALDIDVTDPLKVNVATYLFGGVLFMLAVPDTWFQNWRPGYVWDVPAKADPANGHGVWWGGIDAKGNAHGLTWGGDFWITPAGIRACDPSGFVVASLRWFNSQGIAPNGYSYDELNAFWQQMGGAAWPKSPFGPGPSPPPPPPPVGNIVDVKAGDTLRVAAGAHIQAGAGEYAIVAD